MSDLTFMSKFKPDTRCIKEFKYWIVCVRAKQVTLGDAVILLKREIPTVSMMTSEEGAEFPEVIKWYEETCKSKFDAVKFNYVIAMMKDNYVHYHAFPRYDQDISMFGLGWKDKDWPAGISYKEGIEIDENILIEMKEYMQK